MIKFGRRERAMETVRGWGVRGGYSIRNSRRNTMVYEFGWVWTWGGRTEDNVNFSKRRLTD